MLSWTRAISFLLLIYLLSTCASADTTSDTSPSQSTSTSTSPSPSPSSDLDAFLAWLNQHGAELDGIEFVDDGVKGRSVKATKSLKKGHLLARLPFRIFFTIEHLSSTDPDLSDLLQDVSDTNAMAIFTADQATRPDSFWAPYLNYLPSELDTPLTWDDPLLFEALKGTNVVPLMRKRREAVDKRYAALSQVIKDRVSLEYFHWGLAILWSRTFSVKAKSPSGKWESGSAFVPVADMFNTAIPSLLNTDCFTNKESTHFQCSTTKDVEKGEELTAPYSKGLTSGQYLMDYGFVLANNPHHVITIESLPIHPLESEKESTFQTKYQLIRSIKNLRMANESGNPIFQLKDVPSDWINLATSGLPSSLTDILIFTRILSLLDIDASRYSQSQLTQRLITEKRSLHDASDHRAMTILMNMLSFAQHQYELNDDELDAKLDPKYCVGAWCRVAELRVEDMRLINKYTHMAEEYQKTLNPSADDARFGRSPPPRKQKLDKTKPYNRRDEL